MIEQNVQQNQLPNEIQSAFKELNVLQHLRTAGFKKKFGYTCSFLFQLVFVLLFHHKNWFRLVGKQQRRIISWQGCGLSLPESQWLCMAQTSVIA